MTDKIKPIRGDMMPPSAGVPNVRLIEAVEHLLQKAKSGDIQCLAAVMLHSDGSTSHGMMPGAPPTDVLKMVGAMDECKLRLMLGTLGLSKMDGVTYS